MKNTRKLLALVLVLMMVLPMFTVFANAAAPEVLYLTPNANWKQGNARYAAYFFGNGEKWVSMTDSDGDGIYEVAVPAGYPNVIFCRMNPSATANNWNNKWNQTADLVIPTSGPNHYTVKEGTWDSGGGTWSTFGSTCLHTNLGEAATCTTPQVCLDCGDPVVSALGHKYDTAHKCGTCGEQASFTVAGSGAHLGTEWDTGNTANDMTYADGVYTKVYTNVAAGSYAFKVARDHDWGTAYPSADKSYTVATTGSTVTITLKGTTVNVVVEAPHEHVFENGKCECGEEDPNYVPPHVNTLVVGDTNKIVVSGDYVNDYNLPIEWVAFVAEETANYAFVGDNGALAFIFSADGTALISATGVANLEAGTYLICLGNGAVGEFNVAVTKSAWVNVLAEGANKVYVDGSLVNAYNLPITYAMFTVTEKAHYKFTCAEEGALAFIFAEDFVTSLDGYTGEADLEPGTYAICVGGGVTGIFNVTVTKTAIEDGGDDPVDPPVTPELPKLVLGDNTVTIDGSVTNLTGNAIAWYEFEVTVAGTYVFSSADVNGYFYSKMDLGDFTACVCGFTGTAVLEPGTYYICVGKEGKTGEFTVNIKNDNEVVVPVKNTIVVGENTYKVVDGVGFEFLQVEITEPGTYVITGGAPMKVYFFTVPVEVLAGDEPFGWNVDAMTDSGFADSFEVTLGEAGTYWMGFNYDFVDENAPREYTITLELKAEEEPTPEPEPEPEMNFFQKIIAWIMDLIEKILAYFKK